MTRFMKIGKHVVVIFEYPDGSSFARVFTSIGPISKEQGRPLFVAHQGERVMVCYGQWISHAYDLLYSEVILKEGKPYFLAISGNDCFLVHGDERCITERAGYGAWPAPQELK